MLAQHVMILEHWWLDLRSAWRGLRRAMGFTAAAVLTLTLGIAGTTVVFALVEGVLLRPLPVPEQDRLIVAWRESRVSGLTHFPFGARDIAEIGRESTLFDGVAGVGYSGAGEAAAVERGETAYISVADVTGDFFRVVGVRPILGRTLLPADDVTGSEHVLVIAHGLWQRRYGGSRDVIGRRLTIAGQPFTIVGVMPQDFEYPRGAEAWETIAALTSIVNPAFREAARRDVDIVARLRPGVSIEQARSELQAIASRQDAIAPTDAPRGLTPVVRSYEQAVVGDVRPSMLMLFAAVGLVLLISIANAANLLLLRVAARRPELAVRVALGAGRAALVRQLIGESLILASAAGASALAVASWTLRAVVSGIPGGLPRADSVRVDAGVVLFTAAVVALTAALASGAPALSLSRADLAPELRYSGRGAGRGARGRGRRALVVAQVAIAMAILVAASLLTRSLLRLETVDMGLAADRLVLLELDLPQDKYAGDARHVQLLDDLVASLESAPGIAAATPVNTAPFAETGGWDVPRFTAEGQSADRALANPSLNLESIHSTYFRTLEIPVVRGRGFAAADRRGAAPVAIVSEDVAARTWPGADPVGMRIKFGGAASREPWMTVVGVAGRTRYRELTEARPTLYLPAEQFIVAARMLVLRTTLPAAQVARLSRERVRDIDPRVQVMRAVPFARLLDKPLARPRFRAFLIDVFGATALLLASVGLFAVLGAAVRERGTEIGVRVALGATAADVRRLVLAEGLRIGLTGAAIGLVAATVATRLLRGMLYDVQQLDPRSLLAAASLVALMALLACYLPARRAAQTDPIAMLRQH